MSREKAIDSLIDSVIIVSNRFINKVNTGRARSKETYFDLLKLKTEAQLLKKILVEKDDQDIGDTEGDYI